jgi:Ser/Thr protein kinase RdoA (MazF antagonist)
VIHADANDSNVLVDPGDRERIAGVVDFGDMVHSALVNDLAVAVASVIPGGPDPLADAGSVVAGYHTVTPLAEEEIALLFDLTATRLVMSVLISAWRSKLHPENVAYIAASDASEWSTLERIDRTNRELAHAGFRAACGLVSPRPKRRR